MKGYQSKSPPVVCPIVNGITKASLPDGRDVLLIMNNGTLIEDSNEKESLAVPFDMMRHGVLVDIVPKTHGGSQGITVENEFLPCWYDEEKCFYTIQKPTQYDLDILESYEITSPNVYPNPGIN